MKKPAVKKPAAKTPLKEDIPTEPYELSFDSDGEPVDSDDDDEEERPPQAANVFRGNAFRCELQERGQEVRCGAHPPFHFHPLPRQQLPLTLLWFLHVSSRAPMCLDISSRALLFLHLSPPLVIARVFLRSHRHVSHRLSKSKRCIRSCRGKGWRDCALGRGRQ